MATEESRLPGLHAVSAALTRNLTGEHAHHLHHEMNMTQTDSAPFQTDGVPPSGDKAPANVAREHAHRLHHELDTTQTDSGPLPTGAKTLATSELFKEFKSTVAEAKPFAAESTSGSAAVTSGAAAPSEARKDEPQTGAKRDLDSAPAAPVPTAEKVEEGTGQPGAKKQKKEDGDRSKDVNGTSAASGASSKPTSSSRSKKDKAKDALKQAIPTDGIGSRTRSRTKGT